MRAVFISCEAALGVCGAYIQLCIRIYTSIASHIHKARIRAKMNVQQALATPYSQSVHCCPFLAIPNPFLEASTSNVPYFRSWARQPASPILLYNTPISSNIPFINIRAIVSSQRSRSRCFHPTHCSVPCLPSLDRLFVPPRLRPFVADRRRRS